MIHTHKHQTQNFDNLVLSILPLLQQQQQQQQQQEKHDFVLVKINEN